MDPWEEDKEHDSERYVWEMANPGWKLRLTPNTSPGHYTGGTGNPFNRRWVFDPDNGNHNFKVIAATVFPEPEGGTFWDVDAISVWGDELHDYSDSDKRSAEGIKRFIDTLLINYINDVYDSVDWGA